MNTTDERTQILEALSRWIAQRPGLDPHNYISHGRDDAGRSAYRSEVRSITKDLNHARTLLGQVKWRDSITAEHLKAALRGNFSGRLSWENGKLDYCTGQYWPTEYRRAVCAVLAGALWTYFRENMPAPNGKESRNGFECDTYNGLSAGDYIRRTAKRELGASIAKRWFN